jgi:hypothetical protein
MIPRLLLLKSDWPSLFKNQRRLDQLKTLLEAKKLSGAKMIPQIVAMIPKVRKPNGLLAGGQTKQRWSDFAQAGRTSIAQPTPYLYRAGLHWSELTAAIIACY